MWAKMILRIVAIIIVQGQINVGPAHLIFYETCYILQVKTFTLFNENKKI